MRQIRISKRQRQAHWWLESLPPDARVASGSGFDHSLFASEAMQLQAMHVPVMNDKQSHPGCKLSTLAVLAPDNAWNVPWFLLTQGS